MDKEELMDRIRKYPKSEIEFTSYCNKKMVQRNISEEVVLGQLLSSNEPYSSEKQLVLHQNTLEDRYKLVFSLSSRYSLIIIIVLSPNSLKVINAIKTSKKVQEKWKKEASK